MTEANGNQDNTHEDIEDDLNTYINEGRKYYSINDYDRAIKEFDQAIRLAPNNTRAYIWRGRAYRWKDDYDRAIKEFDHAIRLESSNAKAYIWKGRVYRCKGDYDSAIEAFQQAININKKDITAYIWKGRAYHWKGDNKSAIKTFQQAIDENGNDVTAYIWKGRAHHWNGDNDAAIETFEEAKEIDKNDSTARVWKGRAHVWKGDNDNAIEFFGQAIGIDKNYVDAFIDRGYTYLNNQKYDLSFKDFLAAIKIDPDIRFYSIAPYIASQLSAISEPFQISSFQYCTQIWKIINEIKGKLLKKDTIVTHYTSLDVLKNLLSGERFRFYNATYMNDPEEGDTFFKILKERNIDVENIFKKNSTDLYSPAYIGSFTKADNLKQGGKLFLWRTYGKHKNQEASGACMVFNGSSCFSSNVPSEFGAMKTQQNFSEEETLEDLCLYEVVYEKIMSDPISNDIDRLSEQLHAIDEKCLKKVPSKAEKNVIRGLVRGLLDEIRFLFKDDHYSEENEMRVILMRYIPIDGGPPNSYIKEDTYRFPPRLYLDAPERFRFDKVLLGPQAPGLAEWQQWARLKPQGRGVPIVQSKIRYRSS